MTHAALLVIAKAPVPGLAKTRLCPPATPEQAAEIAAGSLLDTLDAVVRTPDVVPVIAMTGDPRGAARSGELAAALRAWTVLPQRGETFPHRLANAHHDVANALGLPVLQIGMDTPQVTPELLGAAVRRLGSVDAVLGPARDGGWWAIGFRDARHAEALRQVPTSRPDTGARTRQALLDIDLQIETLPTLSDVDTVADANRLAARLPASRFASATRAVVRDGCTTDVHRARPIHPGSGS